MNWSKQELLWIEDNQAVLEAKDLEKIPGLLKILTYDLRLRMTYCLAYIYGLPIVVEGLGYINGVYALFNLEKVGLGSTGVDNPVVNFMSHQASLGLPKTWELKQVDTYSTVKTWKIVDTKSSV